MNPLQIANLMAGAANKKAQKPKDSDASEPDADDAPPAAKSKKMGAMKEKDKAKGGFPPKKGL